MLIIDTAQLAPWIGRTIEAVDEVTPRLVEGYRATFAPHLAAVEAACAPLGLHWCLAPPMAAMAELGPDGHPVTGGFLPPVPLPRRMWGGGEIEIATPLKIGDRVTRRSTIADIRAKQGRSGPLYIVQVRHAYSVDRRIAIRERQDIIYRSAATGVSTVAQPEPAADKIGQTREAGLTWTVDASPVLLFRYSALTFNGHRIHYDQPYATLVEGYDGLIVHGPLQASLLLNLAACLLRACPSRFTYRALAPLFADQSFNVCGAHAREGVVNVWAHDPTRRITLEATAAAIALP